MGVLEAGVPILFPITSYLYIPLALAGAIPPELGKLAALKELELQSNQLTGE